MASKVLLISENTLKKYTLINDNVDCKYILPAITLVQDVDLDLILGPVLNQKLQDMVEDGTIAGNADYKKLLDDYVTPYMAWKVMAAIQLNINYKFTNSGMVQNQDDHKTGIDYANGRNLQAQYERYAEAYGTKLRDYLVRWVQKYPEYTKCQTYEYAEDQQLCSIYLPSNRKPYKYLGK